ncbi:MAG: winged helix-turn-helix transcriptional regulator [Pseudomonadota bacterium]|nr:winged helix-turn-helix transcriptional regulator [Pseudomonadota bacterium]
MRELMFGARRFGEIKVNLPGVSANVLTQRLESLAANGIVVRYRLPSPANVQVYGLTDWGRESEGVIRDLGHWAARSPRHNPLAFMSPASAMMSLCALIDRDRAAVLTATVAFRFPADAFVVRVADGDITVARGTGEAGDAAVVFTGDTLAMRYTIYGKRPLSRGGAGGTLAVEGDMETAQRFIDLFALPEKILLE